jgi:selenocysteine lyase/cysteine desulfurase
MGSIDVQLPVVAKSQFGTQMRGEHFSFADSYQPLNHGSFGTFPKPVLEYQRKLQNESEARPDTFIRYTYLDLLNASRSAIAPLLGADPHEVVLVPNATTGVNTILRNLKFDEDDVIIHFNTIYGACIKTIQSLSEICPVSTHEVNITYPIDDVQIIGRFRAAVEKVRLSGKAPRLAMFDTVLTFPGVRFPWEELVKVCKEQGVLSFIDGAHGLGHIDMTHMSDVGPDFMISNCYK